MTEAETLRQLTDAAPTDAALTDAAPTDAALTDAASTYGATDGCRIDIWRD
jgi:hypothetical protein